MNKHTPGPWKWNTGRLLHNEPGRYSSTVLDIEEPRWRPSDQDAHLIAAAPELLEALEAMLEECDPMKLNCGEPWCRARAAIAKARGEA